MAKKTGAPQTLTAEAKLAAKKARAEAANNAAAKLEQAIKDKPNLEAEVVQAEKNLTQWEAAGSGFKADLRRKLQALSDCKQLLGEPVRAKKAPAGQPPAEATAGPQGETLCAGGATEEAGNDG